MAIVGAGYTGLWTAYYLKRAQPSLRVVVLEAERAGFGASGRNGGWVTATFSGAPRAYRARAGPAAYATLTRTMFETVDEIAGVLAQQRIDADFVKGGQLMVARNGAQAERLRAHVRELRALGIGEHDLQELSGDRLAQRVRVAGAQSATFSPHAARVHPAKLAAGLAATVQALGVTIYERTPRTRAARARGAHRAWRGASALDRARDRGLHGRAARHAPRARADEQLDDRHRAPAAERLGADRLGGVGGARRRRACVRVPAAHRRRAHRDRRARRALPLRLAAPARVARPRRRPCEACARSCSTCSRRSPACTSSTPGRACSACRATGCLRSASTPIAAMRGPAATSDRASPRRTSPGARCATCCSASPSALTRAAVGRAPAARVGARAAALGRHPRGVRAVPPGGSQRVAQRPPFAPGAARRRRVGPALTRPAASGRR